LPVVDDGELLAVLEAGAYGAVVASIYNTRGKPAEMLVDGRKALVIRERESFRDQTSLERL
jgi:diaminopimelate decarboxylase